MSQPPERPSPIACALRSGPPRAFSPCLGYPRRMSVTETHAAPRQVSANCVIVPAACRQSDDEAGDPALTASTGSTGASAR